MVLSLSGNPLTVVKSGSFARLTFLTKLDLSNCQIASVQAGAFEGLSDLQRMYLHGNKLTSVEARDLPPSLHGITIHENRYKLSI